MITFNEHDRKELRRFAEACLHNGKLEKADLILWAANQLVSFQRIRSIGGRS